MARLPPAPDVPDPIPEAAVTLELRRTCRCGHLRALHAPPLRAARPDRPACRSCACERYVGGLVVVLTVRAQQPAARVVVPDEVPEPPSPYVRRAHSAGTGGVRHAEHADHLPASLLVSPRTPPPLATRQHERA